MYYTKSEIQMATKFDTIVKVNEEALVRCGFYRFVTEYKKHNYGYLFCKKFPYFDYNNNIGVILPVVFDPGISRVPQNYYVNYFRNQYCEFHVIDVKELHNISLSERINSFFKIKHYICKPIGE